MAANYAPPRDDPGSYASLPGTSGTEFVQHNMTPMKSHLEPGREVAGTIYGPPRSHYHVLI